MWIISCCTQALRPGGENNIPMQARTSIYWQPPNLTTCKSLNGFLSNSLPSPTGFTTFPKHSTYPLPQNSTGSQKNQKLSGKCTPLPAPSAIFSPINLGSATLLFTSFPMELVGEVSSYKGKSTKCSLGHPSPGDQCSVPTISSFSSMQLQRNMFKLFLL